MPKHKEVSKCFAEDWSFHILVRNVKKGAKMMKELYQRRKTLPVTS